MDDEKAILDFELMLVRREQEKAEWWRREKIEQEKKEKKEQREEREWQES